MNDGMPQQQNQTQPRPAVPGTQAQQQQAQPESFNVKCGKAGGTALVAGTLLLLMNKLIDGIPPRLLVMILISVLVVGVFGAYSFLFENDMVEFDRLCQLRTDSEVDVASEDARVSDQRATSLERQIDTLENQLFGKGLDLPPSQMVSHIIGQLDRLSAQHGVQLIAVKPGERSDVLSFAEVPFDVEVSGIYFDLFAGLEAAEIELRPMVDKQFQLSPGPEEILQMSLRVVSYRSPSKSG